jgi:hypothetical protein
VLQPWRDIRLSPVDDHCVPRSGGDSLRAFASPSSLVGRGRGRRDARGVVRNQRDVAAAGGTPRCVIH